MKKRFKNWITSIIGIIVMGSSTTLYFWADKVGMEEYSISMVEYITLLIVGWVFLSAKDTLLEGILGNFIKMKPKD